MSGDTGTCEWIMRGFGTNTLVCDLLSGHAGMHHDPLTGADWGQYKAYDPRSVTRPPDEATEEE